MTGFLFEEMEDDREIPEWRGEEKCVWKKCPGRFEFVQALSDECHLLRCSVCSDEFLKIIRGVEDDDE